MIGISELEMLAWAFEKQAAIKTADKKSRERALSNYYLFQGVSVLPETPVVPASELPPMFPSAEKSKRSKVKNPEPNHPGEIWKDIRPGFQVSNNLQIRIESPIGWYYRDLPLDNSVEKRTIEFHGKRFILTNKFLKTLFSRDELPEFLREKVKSDVPKQKPEQIKPTHSVDEDFEEQEFVSTPKPKRRKVLPSEYGYSGTDDSVFNFHMSKHDLPEETRQKLKLKEEYDDWIDLDT